jgi:signal transduction histidine kinase
MSVTLQQVLSAVERNRAGIAAAVQETSAAPSRRAAQVVGGLQSTWPTTLYGCLLEHDSEEAWSALSADGSPPAAAERLRTQVRAWLHANPQHAGLSRLETLPDLSLPGPGILVAALACHGRCYGALACAPTADDPAAAAMFLALAAEQLAVLLFEETSGAATSEERDRSAWLANVSELTSIVAHEFNNLLNGILLHIAVLKQDVPKEMQSELEVIRGLGNNAAQLIKQLQKYNSRRRGSLQSVDLNQVVRNHVGARHAREPALALQMDLDPQLPTVQAKACDVDRLISVLIDQSRAAMGSHPSPILIRTLRAGNRSQLRIEDAGPPIEESLLPRIFEPFTVVRPGGDEAALAICHTLARHMHASLRAENRPDKGVAITVDFTPAAK